MWDWRGGGGGGAALPRRPALCILVTGGCGVGSLSLVGGGRAPGSVCSCDRPTAVWVGMLGRWGSRVSGRGMRVRRAALSRICVHARCCRAWTPRGRWRVRHWGSWLACPHAAVAISGVFPGGPRPRPIDAWRCFPLGLGADLLPLFCCMRRLTIACLMSSSSCTWFHCLWACCFHPFSFRGCRWPSDCSPSP